MAGIGFELRKIYGRKTLVANLWGTIYATMTTIGPAVLSAILLLILNILLDASGTTEFERRLFISTTTYAFVIAMLASVVFSAPVSRYISDCVFLKKEEDICPSAFGVLALTSIISAIVMLVLCICMYNSADQIPVSFIVPYYFLGILVTDAYTMMTYASALKQYRALTLGFLIGLILAICVYYLGINFMSMQQVTAACIGLVVCFLVVVFILILQVIRAFGMPKDKFFAYLSYFNKYPKLAVGCFAYTLGLYFPTILYWFFSPMAESVNIFQSFPAYDMGLFMAIVVNMPSLVIFVVKVETAFYDKYTLYVSALNKGTYDQIERERKEMIKTLRYQLLFVIQIQFIITLMLVAMANVFLPYVGISTDMLQMFTFLSFGVYAVFCMYFIIVMFYYFSDYSSACISSLVFLIVTAACAVLALFLNDFYPFPLLIGGICGWIVAFILLRRRTEDLDSFLMC